MSNLYELLGIKSSATVKAIRAAYRMGNPLEFEIVNDMKILLGGSLDEIQRKRKEIEGHRAKSERLLGRFGGEKKDHAYGKTAYNLQVLMNKAMHGAFTA